MKNFIPGLITGLLLSSALTPAAEVKKQNSEPVVTDTVKTQPAAPARPARPDNQQILNQEDEQEREEMEDSDLINEFGQELYFDNGNGATTNQKIDWPEP